MAEWDEALLVALGVPVTKQNRRFLRGWQRWEGGHTNNDAKFNWLNTTKKTPGAVASINSVGVKAYRSFDDGIAATVETLRNGRYQDILDALGSGNPFKAAPTAGLSTWVSGSPTGNLSYANKVLGTKVKGGKTKAAPVRLGPAPAQQARSKMDFFEIAFEDDPEFLQLLGSITDRQAQQGTTLPTGQPLQVAPGGSVRPIVPANGVIKAAQTQLGKPYVFGSGPNTDSFDCSDLVQWAYKQVGIDIPRTTYDQMKVLPRIDWKDLAPGDLLYKDNGGHVVMYVGNGKVIAAPYTGTVVQYQPLARFRRGGYHVRRVPQ